MPKRYTRPLTLEEMANVPDEDIDTSDIPELGDWFWDNAVLVPPRTEKPNVSLRLPQEVVDFFKADSPKGYTSRMAAVLSAYVDAHQKR